MSRIIPIVIITVLLIICNYSIYSQQYWNRITSPVNNTLYVSFFTDTINGWAAGDSGIIIRTSNSGASWAVQNTGITDYKIEDIFFINQNTGWAISNDYFFTGTKILRTTNGGLNWSGSIYPDTTLIFNNVYFIDNNTGFLSGYSGEIHKTTNAGISWFACNIDTNYCRYLYLFPKNKLYFLNSMTGYACGGQIDIQGIVWKTTDGGLNWLTYCVGWEPLHYIKAVNSNFIIACGGDFEYGLNIVISSDGGNNWEYDETGVFGKGSTLSFRTSSEVWVPLTFGHSFAINNEGGAIGSQWHTYDAPDSVQLNSIIFISQTLGFAFGSGGSIFKYNSSAIGINSTSEIMPESFIIYQNYPNPFNPETEIKYYVYSGSIVTIEIYSVTGGLIEVLNNTYQPSGYHTVKWQADNYPSGIYFCKVTSGGVTKSIKMVLMK